jgi:predicted dehydrogenase/threonine dehydrogenase-like Zn-dependent dehydrogenase
MHQILQNIKTGELKLEEVPSPSSSNVMVQVKTYASLISAGTEKMLIDLAKKSIVGKAQARPDLVKQVINKAKKEGWLNTFNNVMSKMEKPMPLGYSAAGIVETHPQTPSPEGSFSKGIRVAIAGAGYANHAEINSVPYNLCAVIPDNVSFEEAAYTTVASIALQGVRLAKPELGDFVVVSGLGLIGLITIQLLKANGCRVIGIDYDQHKIDLGLKLGMDEGINLSSDNALKKVENFTGGRLADCTIITAATKSNQPIELAGEITRRKGQVIAVGAVGLNIPRDVYYKKEIEIKISMSYGPGRYDASYEEGGIDYPYDYVRWTEQRNMEAVLALMSQGKLDVKSLTTHHFPFKDALAAYDMIKENKEPFVGIILEYDVEKEQKKFLQLKIKNEKLKIEKDSLVSLLPKNDKLNIGFAGAGNYASLHLLPHLKKEDKVSLLGLATATGLSAKQKAEKFGFNFCTTDFDELINNKDINTIFIATRHSSHAEYTIKALQAGKNVFVEKPLCVNAEQLDEIIKLYASFNVISKESFSQRTTEKSYGINGEQISPLSDRRNDNSESVVGKEMPDQIRHDNLILMVGLNRRFAPMIKTLKENFKPGTPKQMLYRVNSGHIPTSSWLHNVDEGGGMLIGEMCHFVDLMSFIAEENPISVSAKSLKLNNSNIADSDNLSMTIEFDGGSVATLNYNTVGDKSYSKERLEIFSDGSIGVLDDFRNLEIISKNKKLKKKSSNQDKGQAQQIKVTMESFLNGFSPIPFNELVNTMLVIFGARKSILTGETVKITAYK